MAAAVAVTALLLLSVAGQAQAQAQPSLASGTFLYGITGGVNFEPPFNLVEYNPVLDYKKILLVLNPPGEYGEVNALALDALNQRLYWSSGAYSSNNYGLYVYDLKTMYNARIATPDELGADFDDDDDPYWGIPQNAAFYLDAYWFIDYDQPNVLRRVPIIYGPAPDRMTTGVGPYVDYLLSQSTGATDIAINVLTKMLYAEDFGFRSVDISNLPATGGSLQVTTIVPYDRTTRNNTQIAFDATFSTLWASYFLGTFKGNWATERLTTGDQTLYPSFYTPEDGFRAVDLAGGNFRSGSACLNVALATNLDPTKAAVTKGLVTYKRVAPGGRFTFQVTVTNSGARMTTPLYVALATGVVYSQVSGTKTGDSVQFDSTTNTVSIMPANGTVPTTKPTRRTFRVQVTIAKHVTGPLVGFQAYYIRYNPGGDIYCITAAGGAINVGPKSTMSTTKGPKPKPTFPKAMSTDGAPVPRKKTRKE